MAPQPSQRRKRAPVRSSLARRKKTRRSARPRGFVGREGSPVLDSYARHGAPAPPPIPPSSAPAPPATALPGASSGTGPGAAPPKGLLSLERPFDIEGFSQLLGENTIRIEVPKGDLPEVLRRVTDFMGFGIYVYSIQVRPAADEMLRRFVVELQRVDFSPSEQDWVAFQEKGTSDSPFGPGASPWPPPTG